MAQRRIQKPRFNSSAERRGGYEDAPNPLVPQGDERGPGENDAANAQAAQTGGGADVNDQPEAAGGFYRGGGSGATKSLTPGEVGGLESDAGTGETSEDEGGFYKNNENGKQKAFWNRRRGIIAGGITSVAVGGIFGFSFLQGPLEFAQVAQLLHNTHFGPQEDAGDSRMSSMLRDVLKGRRAIKNQSISETRVNSLESKYTARIQSQLAEKGIKITTDKLGRATGFTIDTSVPDSPYSGKSPPEIAQTFEESTGLKVAPTDKADFLSFSGQDDLSAFQSIKLRSTVVSTVLDQLNMGKVSTAFAGHVLGHYYDDDNFLLHPIRSLGNVAQKSINNAAVKAWKSIMNQIQGNPPDTGTAAASEEKDKSGNTEISQTSPTETPGVSKISSTLESIADSNGARVAGGITAATALVCMARAVDDNVQYLRYVHIIVPLTLLATTFMSLGYQVMYGSSDASFDAQLAQASKQFNEVNSKGDFVSSWSDAEAVKAGNNQSGGIDLDSSTKGTIKRGADGSIPGLGWTQNSVVSGLCSTAGTVVSGLIGLTLGIASGSWFNTIVGGIVSAVAVPQALSFLSNFIAKGSIDILDATGATFGSYLEYGALFSSNDVAMSQGGAPLTSTQAAYVDNQNSTQESATFHSESIADQVFNPYEPDSVAAHFVNAGSSSFTQNVASMVRGIANLGPSVFKLPADLLSGTASAAPQTVQYDYAGIPQIGFDQNTLNNAADMGENADEAATILDSGNSSDNGQSYQSRVATCFFDTLGKDTDPDTGQQVWDVTPMSPSGDDQDPNYEYFVKSSDYDNADCGDSNANWTIIRLFVLDTMTMKGWDCLNGGNASCADLGIATSGSSTTAVSPTTPPPASSTSGLPLNGLSTGDAKQVITVVASSGSSKTASLQAWDNQNGVWVKHGGAEAAHVGSDGLTQSPKETLSATPEGSFTLTQAFGAKPNPGTTLPYFQTGPDDWWDENPSSSRYNQHVVQKNSPGGNSEHLDTIIPEYNYAVVINANMDPVIPGDGSGFFLHVSDGGPTAGCVSINQNALVSIMQWLNPQEDPRILIGTKS